MTDRSQSKEDRGGDERDEPTPLLEWVAGGLGALLLACALAMIGADALRPQSPADLRAVVQDMRQMDGRLAITFSVMNSGDVAATNVLIEVGRGEVAPGAAGENNAAEVMLDFVPPRGRREAVAVVDGEADRQAVDVRILSFAKP